MRTHSRLLYLLLASATATTASAAQLEGIRMPDRVEVDGQKLVLNGMGLREATIFKVDVYVAGLYLPTKTHKPADIIGTRGNKKIVLHFVRDVDRKDIAKAWSEGFEKNGANLKALGPRIATLKGYMASMKKGDSMAFVERAGKGVQIEVKGKVKGLISGDDFAAGLWGIYFGPEPPNPGLKQGLLGKNR